MQSKNDGVGNTTQKPKSLAVLETEEHAEQVVARADGKDMLEFVPSGHGSAKVPFLSPTESAPQPGRDWESFRPVEVSSAPPPVVPYPEAWHRKSGRVCALEGVGKTPLRLLRARRSY